MTTGEQETVALTEFAGRLKELLSAFQMPSVITQE